jgi:hypothetical protein
VILIAQVLLLLAAAVNVFYAGMVYANGFPRAAMGLLTLAATAVCLLVFTVALTWERR